MKILLVIIGFILSIILSIFMTLAFVGWSNAQQPVATPGRYPTGYEVLSAANKYREANGLPDLVLDQPLCNNIAERAINYEQTDSHDGLQEFMDRWMPHDRGKIWEILDYSTTAEGAVKQWSESPSHDLALRNSHRACAYSTEGYNVMLLSD